MFSLYAFLDCGAYLFTAIEEAPRGEFVDEHGLLLCFMAFLLTAGSAQLEIRVQVGTAAKKATVVECFSCELVGELEVTFLMKWLACYKHQLLFLDG